MFFLNKNHIYVILIYTIIYFICFTLKKDSFHFNKDEQKIKNKYLNNAINSFYYSTITQSTIGYGDIYPIVWWSKLLVISQSILIIYHATD